MSASFPRRGDVYIAHLDPVVGSEQGGRRPVVIIQNDLGNQYSSVVIVAAITSAPAKVVYPIDVLIMSGNAGLRVGSRVMLNQIKSIDKQRLGRYMGRLDQAELDAIDQAIKISLSLP